MTVHLVFPPHWLPLSPYLALPVLAAKLEAEGIATVQHDLSLAAFHWMTERPVPVAAASSATHLALHLSGTGGSDDVRSALSVLGSAAFDQPQRAKGAQSSLDWWFYRLQAGWPDLVIHRYAYTSPSWTPPSNHPYAPFLERWAADTRLASGDIVGLSLTTEHQFLAARTLATAVRRHHPEVRLALGGAWLSRLPPPRLEVVVDAIGADAVVIGEGGDALVELAGDSGWGPGLPPRELQRRHPTLTAPTPLFVDEDLPRYLLPSPVLPIWNAKGCYYNRCSFCDERATFEGRFGALDVDATAHQIAVLHERHPDAAFQLNAECDTPLRLERLARALLDRGVSPLWSARSRIDRGLLAHGRAGRLADAGCRMLVFGVESMDEDVLQSMSKGYDAHDVHDVLSAVGDAGIWRSAFLLLGYPGAQLEDGLRSIDFLEGPPRRVDSFQCSVLRLPWGAPLSQRGGVRAPDAAGANRLARPVADRFPWAFRGATREALLLALGRVEQAEVRGGLGAYLR